MTEKFKKGDRVRCTDNGGSPTNFTAGEVYTVVKLEDDLIWCLGDKGEMDAMFDYRFELVPPHSTYLNGLSLDFPSCNACGRPPEDQCELCKMYGITDAEPQRPRFMTAWLEDDEESFHATGDAFMTLEEAEAFACERLLLEHEDNQIAVFEIRSVHLGRRVVTSEKA